MYTQCPHCQTCFRIAEAHLKVANGKVRCGSCQEVFDATQYLFNNLTDREPITYKQVPAPAPTPAPAPAPAPAKTSPPPKDTAHTAPDRAPVPTQTTEKIHREREKAPDQQPFMESVIGNERYNDLDKMGEISIPGEIDFGDSFIKFPPEPAAEPEPAEPTQPEQPSRTPYEDLEGKRSPATTADHESLQNLLADVDAQLNEDEGKSQLDKDIDELLAFAKQLDLDSEHEIEDQPPATSKPPAAASTSPKPETEEEVYDLDELAKFEKELDATSTGVFAAQQLQEDVSQVNEDFEEEPTETIAVAADQIEARGEMDIADELPGPEIEAAKSTNQSVTPTAETNELPASADEEIPRALRRSLDSLNQLPQRSLGKTISLLLVILILLGGLGFQAVLFRNVALAHQFPGLIPFLNDVCDRIPCRYSGKIDVSQIKLLSRDVRSHPTQANALLISAAFVNQASFDQPYPDILITLSDLGGNVVASRRFTPREYLDKMYNRYLLMESGTPVHITLAVLDPGNDAINFEFSFL